MNDILEEIKELMEDNINVGITPGDPDRIKTFYQGEVVLVPKSYLPALMVIGRQTRQSAHGTAKDQAIYQITIRVVIDVVSEFTEEGTGDIIKSQQTLIDLMEARTTDGIASATSVLGILRRNIKGADYLFTNDFNINYTMLQKSGFFYVAADLDLVATTDLVLRQ